MGFSQALRELRETTVPQLARAVSAVRPGRGAADRRLTPLPPHRGHGCNGRSRCSAFPPSSSPWSRRKARRRARPAPSARAASSPATRWAAPNDDSLQKWILMDALELLLADPKTRRGNRPRLHLNTFTGRPIGACGTPAPRAGEGVGTAS